MNRFNFRKDDVHKVLTHIKLHKKIVPNDILPAWAHRLQDPQIRKMAHGEQALFEGDKRIVPQEQLASVLREILQSPESDVPMSRDSGYHILSKRFLGISRRAYMDFLAKQIPLQMTSKRPSEQTKAGYKTHKRGHLEMDLVEGKKKDFRGKGYNWYWLVVVDRLTGLVDVEYFRKKTALATAGALERILDRMEAKLGSPAKSMTSDDGSEFKAETKALMLERGIKHFIVGRGNKVENVNATFQKIFYRLHKIDRHRPFGAVSQQALKILNNTLCQLTGHTPNDAVEQTDLALSIPYNLRRQKPTLAKGPGTRKLSAGDQVRYLLVKRHKMTFYKSYRGKHWSQTRHPIISVSHSVPPRFYLGALGWKLRDELLFAPL